MRRHFSVTFFSYNRIMLWRGKLAGLFLSLLITIIRRDLGFRQRSLNCVFKLRGSNDICNCLNAFYEALEIAEKQRLVCHFSPRTKRVFLTSIIHKTVFGSTIIQPLRNPLFEVKKLNFLCAKSSPSLLFDFIKAAIFITTETLASVCKQDAIIFLIRDRLFRDNLSQNNEILNEWSNQSKHAKLRFASSGT